MDQDLKRIASELRLPQDSRERIRAQLTSCQRQQEDIPMKKNAVKNPHPADCRRRHPGDGLYPHRRRGSGAIFPE